MSSLSTSSDHGTEGWGQPGADIRIDNRALQTAQWWAALLTVGLPTLGTVYAVTLAARVGVPTLALASFALMHLATMLGITVGFHRYAAHRSFHCKGMVRRSLLVLGCMAAQGPIVHWVSNHRRHHQFSDEHGDVHSPRLAGDSFVGRLRGFWHAHIGWMFLPDVTNPVRYSRDLLRDAELMQINRKYFLWVLIGVLAPAVLVGVFTLSWSIALQTLLWAGLVRIFTVHHATWSINSITHLWGRRPYHSPDGSVNVAWLALPSAGEAWHNGHHAFPGSARFGMRWYQVDLGYLTIWLLEKLGAARQVNRPSALALQKAAEKARVVVTGAPRVEGES